MLSAAKQLDALQQLIQHVTQVAAAHGLVIIHLPSAAAGPGAVAWHHLGEAGDGSVPGASEVAWCLGPAR